MAKFLISLFLIVSSSAFSQSYLIMDNGIIVTTDKSGFVYDFGNYAYPQKVTMRGGQYFVEDHSVIVTIDENGILYRKLEIIPPRVVGKGLNYFLSDLGELYTIDRKGAVHILVNEAFKNAKKFGGNYFTVSQEGRPHEADLFTINQEGQVNKVDLMPGASPKDIVTLGGNYFMTIRGIVYAVTEGGQVIPREDVRVGIIQKRGGNFFTDSSGFLFTVTNAGEITIPALPMGLRMGSISKTGSNYFLDGGHKLYVVTREGMTFERILQDQDFRNVRIISL